MQVPFTSRRFWGPTHSISHALWKADSSWLASVALVSSASKTCCYFAARICEEMGETPWAYHTHPKQTEAPKRMRARSQLHEYRKKSSIKCLKCKSEASQGKACNLSSQNSDLSVGREPPHQCHHSALALIKHFSLKHLLHSMNAPACW